MAQLEGICIRRVHRQHTSAVIVLPYEVRRAMKIKVGDYLIFSSHKANGVVELHRFEPGGKQNGGASRNSSRKNQRGRTRVKTRARR
ncbi:hypothetical protein ES703_108750 [subsurface metagenome]